MDERDILVFTDEEGQEIQMEILDYFEYDDQLYAMLIEAEENHHGHDHECDHDHDHEEETDVYIMKVIVEDDTEKFVPVEEEVMDELIEAIQAMYEEEFAGDEHDN
jgi:ABC-type Zn2+ transport system substrate-binding protein/surface adhesin